MTHANEPDLGPLTWVKSEIDQALSHAAESLQAALESEDGASKVQFAQTHLHQASGALSIIGLDGLTNFTAALDLFLAALAKNELPLDEMRIALGRRALASIANYLEELVHGTPDQPLRLLPLYRELVSARGEAAPSPADLFFPDLSVRIPPRDEAPKLDMEQRQQQRRAMRLSFQRGLLDWLRQPNADSIDAMRAALVSVELAEDNPGMRSLWWAGQAFIDTLPDMPADDLPAAKLLLPRIESQLHRAGDSPQQTLPERLLRELLYHIASRPASTPMLQAARQTWQLEALIPEEGALVSDLPLGPLLQELHARLTRIKDEWNAIGERGATVLSEFNVQLEAFTKTTAPLGRPVLYRLLGGMSRFIAWLNANPEHYSEPIALEFATALLLAEASLNRGLPDPSFQAQVGDALSRLEALARGEELGAPPSATSVESARKQQEKEAIAQLSREILSSLATIEQTLDDFFRDHSKRAPLENLHTPLHQVEGALSLLGENDAISLIREAGEIIDNLSKQDSPVDDAELTELARRFSALGFFVQSLPYNRTSVAHFLSPATASTQPKPIGTSLPELSDVSAVPVRAKPQSKEPSARLSDGIETFPAFEIETEAEAEIEVSLESSTEPKTAQPSAATTDSRIPAPQTTQADLDAELLAIFIEEAREVLKSVIDHLKLLRASPGNHENLTVIRRGFHTLKGSGRMVGLTDLGEAAWGIEQTLNRWLQLEWQVTPPLLKLLAIAHREFTAWVGQIDKKAEYWRDVSALLEESERLRNSSAPIEQAVPTTASELEVAPEAEPEQAEPEVGLETATEFFNLDLNLQQTEEAEAEEPEPIPAQPIPEEEAYEFVNDDEVDLVPLDEPEAPSHTEAAEPETSSPKAAEPPVRAKVKRPAVPKFEPFDFSPFTSDPDGKPGDFSLEDFNLEKFAPETSTSGMVEFDFGTSTSGTVGFDFEASSSGAIGFDLGTSGRKAPKPDQTFPTSEEKPSEDEPGTAPFIQDETSETSVPEAESSSGTWEQEIPDISIEETIQTETDFAAEEPSSEFEIEIELEPEFEVEVEAEPEPEFEPEPELKSDSDTLYIDGIEISQALFELYVTEAQAHIITLHQEFDHLADNPVLLLPEASLRAAHSCAGISGTAHCTPLYTLGKALELAQQRIHDLKRPPTANELDLFKTSADTLDNMLTKVINLQMPLETPELIEQLDSVGFELPALDSQKTDDKAIAEVVAKVFPEAAASIQSEPALKPLSPTTSGSPLIHDEIDEQLLPIFLEEAGELINALHTTLRAWNGDLTDTVHSMLVKRQLHTLKGSARMAGAMVLGNRVHQLESRMESALNAGGDVAALVDEIASAVDGVEQMVAVLSAGPVPEIPTAETAVEPPADPSIPPVAADSPARHSVFAGTAAPHAAIAPKPSVTTAASRTSSESESIGSALRVRAEMVDGFVNDASEIGVARTRIEGELRLLRHSLLDLTENVIRLRNQLREIEIQADAQMQTRVAQAESSRTAFDPLEMDRYTRLQELTRMMAESVNDVTTVQQNLLKNLDSADFALHSQARTTRELQQALMRVRMVPFDSLAVRLYRIVRRGARDLGKRANLDLRGGGIEIDRSVLDHIVAPLEHLLRNALAHGIEPPEVRRAKNKPEIGQITLTTRQEGNEIVIELADDGAGLDFERIAENARERGLLGPDEATDERWLASMIFLPGFTTAEKVTAVSGRGVGMDVVKAETAAVGGRIDVSSTPGTGTMFSIYLPLTLAVTQALLVRSGTQHYAIPASMISQIMELKIDAIERLRAEGSIGWLGQQYGYRYLPNLLGNPAAQPEIGHYSWVLLLHSGSQTLALHVDGLRGHQEIIVKNAGPQLARIVGMSGATVLGNGEIVLIINPVAMASREITYGQASRLPGAISAMIEAISEPEAEHEPTVMVVDDSLTVRKVTSRLLEREGYRVITAKDGVDAIESLIDNMPDVILSDIEMPRMDGFDLVRNIRADAKLRNVPIIMITSRLADKHRNYAMEIGANHYLGKPYQEEELLGLIAGYTRRA
jgi:chemosensory pili system protein ChpA (sensor histidine kinase/response regulator)